MTVSTVGSRQSHNGNAVTVAFALPYLVLDEDDVDVYLSDVLQTLTTHYTVSGVGDAGGVTITFVTAPPTGTGNVVLVRNTLKHQTTDLVENDDMPSELMETTFDKLMLISQEVVDSVERAVRLSDSFGSTFDITFTPEASKLVGVNAANNALTMYALSDLSSSVVTSFANQLLDDSTAGEMLTTLGVTSFMQTVLDDANAAAALTTLGIELASQAEAEAGTDNTKYMTPLRVAEAISQLASAPGSLVITADDAIPARTLECDGSSLSTTTYAALFAKIGYMYGGSGANFNIPDYRGEFLRGFDNTAGTDPDAGSRTDRGDGTTGDAVGTKQTDELKAHDHDYTDYWVGTGSFGYYGTGQGATNHTTHNNPTGNETRPTNVNVMICIRY